MDAGEDPCAACSPLRCSLPHCPPHCPSRRSRIRPSRSASSSAFPPPFPGWARAYPAKPSRFIVGFPPGGSADPTARLLGAALDEQLNQSVVIENRPGGDSAIGAEYVARQAPDGYTIFFGSNSAMTAAVSLRKAPLYDPLKDFTPIALVGRATFFFH